MAATSDERFVYVTVHAEQRFQERFYKRKVDRAVAIRRCVREIRDAIEHGRRATRKPGWCSPDSSRRGRIREGHIRYLWNAQETHCFVVSRERRLGAETWVVHTVLDRKQPKEEA